jgi:hypothetical protein
MNKTEILKWDFLCELSESDQQKNGRAFKVNLIDNASNSSDFRCDFVDYLKLKGAVQILDEYFGAAILKSGERANFAVGAPLRLFGYKPIEMTIKINREFFNKEFKEQKELIETKEKDLIKCSYNSNKGALLNINNKRIYFTGRNGLIVYYMYQSKQAENNQSYKTYNNFVTENNYPDKYCADSINFRQSIKDINKRVKKETNNYVSKIIDVINNGNKSNEYKWNPEITIK